MLRTSLGFDGFDAIEVSEDAFLEPPSLPSPFVQLGRELTREGVRARRPRVETGKPEHGGIDTRDVERAIERRADVFELFPHPTSPRATFGTCDGEARRPGPRQTRESIDT